MKMFRRMYSTCRALSGGQCHLDLEPVALELMACERVVESSGRKQVRAQHQGILVTERAGRRGGKVRPAHPASGWRGGKKVLGRAFERHSRGEHEGVVD